MREYPGVDMSQIFMSTKRSGTDRHDIVSAEHPVADRRDVKDKSAFLELLRSQCSDCVEVSGESAQEDGTIHFSIKITDKEGWRQKAEVVFPFLGELFFYAFEDKNSGRVFSENKAETLADCFLDEDSDFASTDEMHVVTKGDKVIGFMSLKDYPPVKDLKISYALLTVVDKSEQGGPVSKELYHDLYKHSGADMIVGISHTPAAVKNRLQVGVENGYDSYFCGFRNGVNEDLAVDVEDAEKLSIAEDIAYDYGGETAEVEVKPPAGYIAYKGADTMAPLTEDELRFKPDDPLAATFKKLLEVQKQTSPDVVYGLLVSIRKKKE